MVRPQASDARGAADARLSRDYRHTANAEQHGVLGEDLQERLVSLSAWEGDSVQMLQD